MIAAPTPSTSILTDRPIKESEEVADGIVVDYDDAGRIVGVEILDASKDGRSGSAEDLHLRGAGGRLTARRYASAKFREMGGQVYVDAERVKKD